MQSLKSLLILSSRQRKLCKRLEEIRGRLFRMAYAWSHSQDVADEVVQETMIKAIRSIDKLKHIDAIDRWLFRLLSSCFIDMCRKRREEVGIEEYMLFEQDTPETILLQNEMLLSVKSAIACLPIKHRQVITMVDIESFSYAEVASILDIPQGTVMSRLNRARQSLKNILNQSEIANNNQTFLKVVK